MDENCDSGIKRFPRKPLYSLDDINELNIIFYVIEINPEYNYIQWSLDTSKYEFEFNVKGFNLYFAESENDTYIKINDKLITDLVFKHVHKNYHKIKRGYYKIEALLENNKTIISKEYDIFEENDEHTDFLILREVFGLMVTIPQGFSPALFYCKRYTGQKCPKCSDRNRGAVTGSCPICYGTGYSGGFYNPTLGFFSYSSPIQEATQLGESPMNITQTVARTNAFFGVLRPYDYIKELRPPNRTWVVSAIQKTEVNNRPISLICQLTEAEQSNPVSLFSIPKIKFPKKIWWETFIDDYFEMQDQINKELKIIT